MEDANPCHLLLWEFFIFIFDGNRESRKLLSDFIKKISEKNYRVKDYIEEEARNEEMALERTDVAEAFFFEKSLIFLSCQIYHMILIDSWFHPLLRLNLTLLLLQSNQKEERVEGIPLRFSHKVTIDQMERLKGHLMNKCDTVYVLALRKGQLVPTC